MHMHMHMLCILHARACCTLGTCVCGMCMRT